MAQAMLAAAKEKTSPSLFLLAENSRLGFQLRSTTFRQGFTLSISNTATGLNDPGYEKGRGSRCCTYFRDSDTGLDYADQRYHAPGQGRFFSDDPSGDNWNSADPGSWNTYAYVIGDPINSNDPTGLSAVTLPRSCPVSNCFSAFIAGAAQFGETVQQYFDSDSEILGLMNFFGEQGSGTAGDQSLWAALDWTFLNRWNLSASDKAWFYGPSNIPTTFGASVTTGFTRSQVFTSSGQLTAGFTQQLFKILAGPLDADACQGLSRAFDVGLGTILANNNTPIPGLDFILNPVPGDPRVRRKWRGAITRVGRLVTQTATYTIVDGRDVWNFFTEQYNPPPARPRPPRRPGPATPSPVIRAIRWLRFPSPSWSPPGCASPTSARSSRVLQMTFSAR